MQDANLVITMRADAIVPNNARPSVFVAFSDFMKIFIEQVVSFQVALKLRDT